MLMDAVFGPVNFLNEVIWKRTSAHSGSKRWGPVHDVILFYAKSSAFVWNPVFQKYSDEYVEGFYRYTGEKGRFQVGDLTGAGTRSGELGQPWRGVNRKRPSASATPPKNRKPCLSGSSPRAATPAALFLTPSAAAGPRLPPRRGSGGGIWSRNKAVVP